ncbi:Glutaryl-7-ACA acylase, partial [hydrothermal vent metagenome]
MKKIFNVLLILFIISFTTRESFAVNKYTKHEYQIEMRDGVRLYTIVYSPIDTSEAHPILITRTPYSVGPYGKDKFKHLPSHLVDDEYIFVYQDVRGKFMSQGKYVNMRPYIPNKNGNQVDESSDTYDTIDWLVENIPNNNGNVGIYGISYPGFYSAMSLNDSHPALKAVSPQAPIADWFVGDDMHHNGAFTLTMAYIFFSSFGRERPYPTTKWNSRIVKLDTTSYEYFLKVGPLKRVNGNYFHGKIDFWNKCMIHGTYDEFWQSRNTLNYFDKVTPAVMTVGGWYDNEDLYGTLNTYQTIERKNKNNKNILVMGPWYHGGWARSDGNTFGDMRFGSNTSEFYREEMEKRFFEYYLEGKGNFDLPEAYVFETGKNVWHKYDEWPPNNAAWQPIYFSDNNGLTFIQERKSKIDFNEYISDPN